MITHLAPYKHIGKNPYPVPKALVENGQIVAAMLFFAPNKAVDFTTGNLVEVPEEKCSPITVVLDGTTQAQLPVAEQAAERNRPLIVPVPASALPRPVLTKKGH